MIVTQGSRYFLCFDGLDTLATVYLNGEEIGAWANMFIEAEFDVTQKLVEGWNSVAIRFDPIKETIGDRQVKNQWAWNLNNLERVFVRKAQYQFGWDWAPRLVTTGIWKDVYLEHFQGARIKDVFFKTIALQEDKAQVSVDVNLESWIMDADFLVKMTLEHIGKAISFEKKVSAGEEKITFEFDVQHPALWWTHNFGEPNLYNLKVGFYLGDRLLDCKDERVGIRTIWIDQSPDQEEPGTRFFTFVLNGKPIYIHGSSWIPSDSFPSQVEDDRYRRHIELAKAANINLMREWGGGLYEKDIFYQLCDEHGIMVWQDFMFACALYPGDEPEFLDLVKKEADSTIRRLRNHPSIATWCGNVEIDWMDDKVNWQTPSADFPGKQIFHKVLPDLVQRLDGTREYRPASPYGGNDHNDEREGTRHNWQVWYGEKVGRRFGEPCVMGTTPEDLSYKHYSEDMTRFIEEYGLQAYPPLDTLAENLPQPALRMRSPELFYRRKDAPIDKICKQIQLFLGEPKDLEQYILYSMLVQGEGLKYGIEHYRRRKFHCSGSVFWQYNDAWPCISWSIVDYYLRPKAGYFFVKRAYAPVLASFKAKEDGSFSLWITNDTLKSISDRVTWSLRLFTGEVVDTAVVDITVPANSNQKIAQIPKGVAQKVDPRKSYLYVTSENGIFPDNRLFLTDFKEWIRATPVLSVEKCRTSKGVDVRIRSNVFAYSVSIYTPSKQARYSDNYFDLLPGVEKVIYVWNDSPDPISLAEIFVSCL